MIITVFQETDGTVCGFQVFGHAEYDEPGKDIVCAAVSILTENTINSIEAFTEDVPEALAVNEEEGILYYRLKTVSKESGLLLDSMILGLKGIQESYEDIIQINYEEV